MDQAPPSSNERKPAPAAGIFPKKEAINMSPQTRPAPQKPEKLAEAPPKETFPDPFKVQEQMMANLRKDAPKKDAGEDDVERINDMINNPMATPEDDDSNITPEDMKLAEELIFKGYAEYSAEMPRFPGKKFVITSTNAEEMGIIDDIIFEKIRSEKQNADGTVEMPENAVKVLRSALFVALSYRGPDGRDFAAEPICQLKTLKMGILKLGDLMSEGNIKNAEELKDSIKKALMKRAIMVKRFPTTLIDFLADAKYKFDLKMLRIMNDKNIIPKS